MVETRRQRQKRLEEEATLDENVSIDIVKDEDEETSDVSSNGNSKWETETEDNNVSDNDSSLSFENVNKGDSLEERLEELEIWLDKVWYHWNYAKNISVTDIGTGYYKVYNIACHMFEENRKHMLINIFKNVVNKTLILVKNNNYIQEKMIGGFKGIFKYLERSSFYNLDILVEQWSKLHYDKYNMSELKIKNLEKELNIQKYKYNDLNRILATCTNELEKVEKELYESESKVKYYEDIIMRGFNDVSTINGGLMVNNVEENLYAYDDSSICSSLCSEEV